MVIHAFRISCEKAGVVPGNTGEILAKHFLDLI